ncbi:MAG TPA: DUF6768 family protein [Pirellulales bacterium]|nr:DUF6768 family protein [Pirellulales bacterium]
MSSEDKIIAALNRLDDGQDVDTLSGVLADMTRRQSFFLRAAPAVGILAFMGLAIFAVARFFAVQDVQAWIGYATLFVASLIAMALMKLWLYLVWVRNSLMREIKRLELRSLSSRSL